MTIQEVWGAMSDRERTAVKLADHGIIDEDGDYKVCLFNRVLFKLVNLVLGMNYFQWLRKIAADLDYKFATDDELTELADKFA